MAIPEQRAFARESFERFVRDFEYSQMPQEWDLLVGQLAHVNIRLEETVVDAYLGSGAHT